MASIYDKQTLNKSDLERIKELSEAWNATDDRAKKDQLHNQAEIIRGSYGYSGGGDGGNFILKDADINNVGASGSAYSNAIRNAKEARLAEYANEQKMIEQEGLDRLREAYIKNMRSGLGLDQNLRAGGITGGLSESARAALENKYDNSRNEIRKDTQKSLLQSRKEAAQIEADAEKDAAAADYDSAQTRTNMRIAADERDYSRAQDDYKKMQDKLDREFAKLQFEYQKQLDDYDRKYRAEQDALDREYRAQKDELDRKLEQQKIAASKSSKSSTGSSKSAADKELEEKKNNIWKLLNKGVNEDYFADVLGIPSNVLNEYVNNIMSGY